MQYSIWLLSHKLVRTEYKIAEYKGVVALKLLYTLIGLKVVIYLTTDLP